MSSKKNLSEFDIGVAKGMDNLGATA